MADGTISDPPSSSSCFYREWTEEADDQSQQGECVLLRVLSLNLLADGLAGGDAPCDGVSPFNPMFPDDRAAGVVRMDDVTEEFRFKLRCSSEALKWDRRWPMLLSLILDYEPDVIGLQEVDLAPGDRDGENSAHDAEIRRDLVAAGYEGNFARKHGRALDGVAVFWRKSRLGKASAPSTLSLGSVFVALAQPLVLDGRYKFTAVATHLKAGLGADAEAMRLGQAKSLLHQLWSDEDVLILADLNAHCRPWLDDNDKEVKPQAYSLLANELWSAYSTILGDEPDFTTYSGWAGRDVRLVADYIFFRGEMFTPSRVLGLPSVADVAAYPERMPNPDYPSDHFPMVADFRVSKGRQYSRVVEQSTKRQRQWY